MSSDESTDLQIFLGMVVTLNKKYKEIYLEAHDKALEDLTHAILCRPDALQCRTDHRVVLFLAGGARYG